MRPYGFFGSSLDYNCLHIPAEKCNEYNPSIFISGPNYYTISMKAELQARNGNAVSYVLISSIQCIHTIWTIYTIWTLYYYSTIGIKALMPRNDSLFEFLKDFQTQLLRMRFDVPCSSTVSGTVFKSFIGEIIDLKFDQNSGPSVDAPCQWTQ
jgi:hypothetical protein